MNWGWAFSAGGLSKYKLASQPQLWAWCGEDEDVWRRGPADPVPGLNDHLVARHLQQVVEAELHPVGQHRALPDLDAGDDHVGPVSSPNLHY